MTALLLIMLVSVAKGAGYLVPFMGMSFGEAYVATCDERFDDIRVTDLGCEPYTESDWK